MQILEKIGLVVHPERGVVGRYYRYEIINPLTGRVFYVGKGTGDRMYQHEKATRAILKSGKMMMLKHIHKTIIEIWDAGYSPVYQVTWRTDDEEEAYQMESRRIRELGLEHLTNSTYGYKPKSIRMKDKAKRTPHRIR